MMLLLALACTKQANDPAGGDLASCDGSGALDHTVVVDSLLFGRLTSPDSPDGACTGDPSETCVSPGFDLDGLSSVKNGADGCGVQDVVDEDGNPGIDNAFGYLLPALEATEAAATEDLIQQAIDDGELLVTFDLADLDDPSDDACASLTVGRAAGTPMLGTNNMLLPSQTLDRDPEFQPLVIDHVEVKDGTFQAPFEIDLPISIFDADLDFVLEDGQIRGTIADDGTVTGTFSGGVSVDSILAITEDTNVDPALGPLLQSLLDLWADLAPDGQGGCDQVSIVFSFTSTKMFWYDE